MNLLLKLKKWLSINKQLFKKNTFYLSVWWPNSQKNLSVSVYISEFWQQQEVIYWECEYIFKYFY